MKKIKIIQNATGRFYFGEKAHQHSFVMGIYEDDKLIEIDGVKAKTSFMIDTEDDEFRESILNADSFTNLSDNFEEILQICANHAYKWMSSHDYKNELHTFIKIYKENFEELDNNLIEERKVFLNKQLDYLNRLLQHNTMLPSPEDTLDYIHPLKDRMKSIDKSIASYEKDLLDLKEGSERHLKINEIIDRLKFEKYRIVETLKIENNETAI